MANSYMPCDALAKRRALNSGEHTAVLSVLMKELENKIIESLERVGRDL